MNTVGQVMIRDVITLRPEATVQEAIALLLDRDVSGVPVTDAEGKVLGMVSELALFDVLFDSSIQDLPVQDFMRHTVHTLSEADSLLEAAHQFALHGVRRLPIVREGKLVGILSRRDLLRLCHLQGIPLLPEDLLPGIPCCE